MAMTNLRESTIPQSYKAAVERTAPTFTDKYTGETFKVELMLTPNPTTHFNSSTDIIANVIKTVASILSSAFFKCKAKSALVFQKETGEIVAAAVSDYDAEGENYFYNITFDPNDIKGIDKSRIVNYTDFVDETRNMKFWEIFVAECLTAHNYTVTNEEIIYVLTMEAWNVLFHWLDVNAKPEEVQELNITDYIGKYENGLTAEEYASRLKTVATASVEVIKDTKKMSVQFGEEMKAIAKGCNDLNS